MLNKPLLPQFAPKCKNCVYIGSDYWAYGNNKSVDAYYCLCHTNHNREDNYPNGFFYAIDELSKYKSLNISNDTFKEFYKRAFPMSMNEYSINMMMEVD